MRPDNRETDGKCSFISSSNSLFFWTWLNCIWLRGYNAQKEIQANLYIRVKKNKEKIKGQEMEALNSILSHHLGLPSLGYSVCTVGATTLCDCLWRTAGPRSMTVAAKTHQHISGIRQHREGRTSLLENQWSILFKKWN